MPEDAMPQDCYFVPNRFGEYVTAEIPLFVNCAGISDGSTVFTAARTQLREDVSLYYMTAGNMDFSIGDSPLCPASAGTLILCPPGVRMTYRHAEPAEKCYYWVHFTGSYALPLLDECGFSGGGVFQLAAKEKPLSDFAALLGEMRHLPDTLTRLRAAATVVTLLTTLGRLRVQGGRRSRLFRSLSYLQAHFTEEVDKEALAAMDGLGLSQYNLLFRQLTGYSPARWQTRLRMSMACDLLRNTAEPVFEIAARCGYADPLYFCRAFRRECGASPTAFRRLKSSEESTLPRP